MGDSVYFFLCLLLLAGAAVVWAVIRRTDQGERLGLGPAKVVAIGPNPFQVEYGKPCKCTILLDTPGNVRLQVDNGRQQLLETWRKPEPVSQVLPRPRGQYEVVQEMVFPAPGQYRVNVNLHTRCSVQAASMQFFVEVG